MAHSPADFMVAAAADQGFSWVHASADKIAGDPVIHALIDKVRVGPEPTENLARYRQGASVVIRTNDGHTPANTVACNPKGSAVLGLSWDDIDLEISHR